MKRLEVQFFGREVLEVAPDLLGKVLVRQRGKEVMLGLIVETEAYGGEKDKASHARFGLTKRNQIMYGRAGRAYVYLIYGMYWMLNVITGSVGQPQGVLIRGVWLVAEQMIKGKGKGDEVAEMGEVVKLDGPGKVTRALQIDGSHYGVDLTRSEEIYIARSKRGEEMVKSRKIIRTKRIGIDYAEEWAEKEWRYLLV